MKFEKPKLPLSQAIYIVIIIATLLFIGCNQKQAAPINVTDTIQRYKLKEPALDFAWDDGAITLLVNRESDKGLLIVFDGQNDTIFYYFGDRIMDIGLFEPKMIAEEYFFKIRHYEGLEIPRTTDIDFPFRADFPRICYLDSLEYFWANRETKQAIPIPRISNEALLDSARLKFGFDQNLELVDAPTNESFVVRVDTLDGQQQYYLVNTIDYTVAGEKGNFKMVPKTWQLKKMDLFKDGRCSRSRRIGRTETVLSINHGAIKRRYEIWLRTQYHLTSPGYYLQPLAHELYVIDQLEQREHSLASFSQDSLTKHTFGYSNNDYYPAVVKYQNQAYFLGQLGYESVETHDNSGLFHLDTVNWKLTPIDYQEEVQLGRSLKAGKTRKWSYDSHHLSASPELFFKKYKIVQLDDEFFLTLKK